MPKKKPFNNPFGRVKLDKPPPPEQPAPAAPAAPVPTAADARRPLSDDDLWTLAVEGAAPLADRSARIKPDPEPIATAQGPLDPELAAYDELESFLSRSRQAGKRCVLVVHGRGLHSKDQMPVLKDALKRWMSTARFADHVLAFATARPHDGGLGAVYVLLRRL